MLNAKFILDGHTPVPEPDLQKWAQWFETPDNRRVASETIAGYTVSTVFLGLDHRFGAEGPPLLFETMTFDPDGEGGDCRRYSTWDEALAGHYETVAALKGK